MKNEKQPLKVDFKDRLSAFLLILVMAIAWTLLAVFTVPFSIYRLIIEKESMRSTWTEFRQFTIEFWRK